MKDSKYYKKKMKSKVTISDKEWLTKLLLSIIVVLLCLISTNISSEFKNIFRKNVLEENISFTKFNELYKKYVGSYSENEDGEETLLVNGEESIFNKKNEFIDGSYYISVGVDYPIKCIQGGLIVFNGDRDNFKNTVIVQGNDGVDIWYSNLLLDGYSLYDYVSEGDLLGSSLEDNLILTFMKDGKYMSYEEYIK